MGTIKKVVEVVVMDTLIEDVVCDSCGHSMWVDDNYSPDCIEG